MLAAMSRRKHKLSAAASRGVKGGTRRVFTSPARGALAISPSAQTRVDILECVIADPLWLGPQMNTAASDGSRKLLMLLVGARGFEPPTSRSQTERTTRLCYAPKRLRHSKRRLQDGQVSNRIDRLFGFTGF